MCCPVSLASRIIRADLPFLGCHEPEGIRHLMPPSSPTMARAAWAESDERMYCGDVVGLGVPGGQLDGAAEVGGGYGCPRRAPG
jgi:hypothetical protein